MGVEYWISCARHQETLYLGKNRIYVKRRAVDGIAILEAFREEVASRPAVSITLPERQAEKESNARHERMVVAFVKRHDGCSFVVRNDAQGPGLFSGGEFPDPDKLEFSIYDVDELRLIETEPLAPERPKKKKLPWTRG